MKIKSPPTSASKLSALGLAAALLLLAGGCSTDEPPSQLPPLNTMSRSSRLPGKFVWADLVTDDVPAAQKFYSRLFGWTFRNVGDYVIVCIDDRPLGGMFQRPRPADRSAQPRWFGYISVANVERAKRAVIQAGGRMLMAPERLPKRGEQAVFADAEGAVFGVVKSSSGDPQDFLADPGDWIWIQLLSRDGRKAADFYRAVGGYQIVENAEPNRVSDFVLTSEGYARATVRTIPQANTQVQPTWLPFVRVKNVPALVARAKELGGKVLVEPASGLLDGKVAVVADPTGAAIGIMEWDEKLLKGGR
jgi:predicted enzyme related to lactoylglutathione lyase